MSRKPDAPATSGKPVAPSSRHTTNPQFHTAEVDADDLSVIMNDPMTLGMHAQAFHVFRSGDSMALRSSDGLALRSSDALALGVDMEAIHDLYDTSNLEAIPDPDEDDDDTVISPPRSDPYPAKKSYEVYGSGDFVVLRSTDGLDVRNHLQWDKPKGAGQVSEAARALRDHVSDEGRSTGPKLTVGDLVSERFHLVNELGRGGNAIVFQAMDNILDREVALKFMLGINTSEHDTRGAFDGLKHEITLMQQIRHPNIAAVYDMHLLEDVPYVSMELLRGRTLHHLIGESRAMLSIPQVVRYARQMLSALQAAHERGVVHRDLKPLNIMVDENEDCTVFDFGMARVTDSGDRGKEEKIIGTPAIMAPEMIDFSAYQLRDHRVDIYAFGVVLFAMLSLGRYPILGRTSAQTLLGHLLTPPAPISVHRPDTPQALQVIIERCLRKNPTDRYESAAEIIEVLDVYMEDPARAALRLGAQRNRDGRLLVIDPDPDRRGVIADLLELSGRRVHRFENLRQAQDVLGRAPCAAIFINGDQSDDQLRIAVAAARSADPDNPAPAVVLGGPNPAGRSLPEGCSVLPEPVGVGVLGKLLKQLGLGRNS